MEMPDTFGQRYESLLDWSYDSIDRLVLNGRFNLCCSPGGFRYWWRLLFGDDKDLNNKGLERMSYECSRRVHQHCQAHGIRLIGCGREERKDEVSAPYVQAAKASGKRGLFLVLTGRAPAPVWDVKVGSSGKILNLAYKRPWPFVKHYHFHIWDDRWGHVIIRMSGYPPFGIQVILNGHNWTESQLLRLGKESKMDGNCFTGGDQQAVKRWSSRLFTSRAAEEIRAVCERWAYTCACHFGLPKEERERTGFSYNWSVYQLELSRNYHFSTPAALDEIYQSVIDLTRRKLGVKRLQTIFGVRGRPRIRKNRAVSPGSGRGRRDAVSCTLDAPEYDLTVFKVHWANRTLKLYDKGERTLRGEAVVHNARELKTGRGLDNWEKVVDVMHKSLNRYFDALDALDVGLVDAGGLNGWREPSWIGENRLAGIALENVRMRALIGSMIELSVFNRPFKRSELVAKTAGKMAGAGGYTPRMASYDTRKLRAKDVLLSAPRGKKYTVNLERLRSLAGIICIQDKVLKPICAVGHHYQPQPKPRQTQQSVYEEITVSVKKLLTLLHLEAA